MDKIDKTPIDKDFGINNQKSNQENTQDLDQEQNVTTNPFQFNSQNVKIILSDSQNNYSGKITGTTYLDKYNEIVSDVIILLYFGNDMAFPVCKTFSNKSGKFAIEDIPPGYYKIRAFMGKDYLYLSNYIKVLPRNSIDHPIFLKENIKKYESHY